MGALPQLDAVLVPLGDGPYCDEAQRILATYHLSVPDPAEVFYVADGEVRETVYTAARWGAGDMPVFDQHAGRFFAPGHYAVLSRFGDVECIIMTPHIGHATVEETTGDVRACHVQAATPAPQD